MTLREFSTDDLDDCMAVVGDSAVTDFLSFDTRNRDEQADLLAKDIERAQSQPRPDYYLAIADHATDRLVGVIRMTAEAHRRGELGYALRKDQWGRGLASEACALMVDYAFSALDRHRVQAAVGPDNQRSLALVDKLGFTYEGRMRDHVFTNGAWRDSLLYSILRHEHLAERQQ